MVQTLKDQLIGIMLARIFLVKIGHQTLFSLQKDKDTQIAVSFDSEIGDPLRHSIVFLLPC